MFNESAFLKPQGSHYRTEEQLARLEKDYVLQHRSIRDAQREKRKALTENTIDNATLAFGGRTGKKRKERLNRIKEQYERLSFFTNHLAEVACDALLFDESYMLDNRSKIHIKIRDYFEGVLVENEGFIESGQFHFTHLLKDIYHLETVEDGYMTETYNDMNLMLEDIKGELANEIRETTLRVLNNERIHKEELANTAAELKTPPSSKAPDIEAEGNKAPPESPEEFSKAPAEETGAATDEPPEPDVEAPPESPGDMKENMLLFSKREQRGKRTLLESMFDICAKRVRKVKKDASTDVIMGETLAVFSILETLNKFYLVEDVQLAMLNLPDEPFVK